MPYYRRALEVDERMPLVHARLANYLLLHDDDPQAALPHAARAVELAETEASYHRLYVDLLERLGKSEIAARHVRRFAARFPSDPTFGELKRRYGVED
jgi:Tfp pilus assembly protein PilF